MFHLMSFRLLLKADYQCITRYGSSLVFRSKRLAAMRGVFVCAPEVSTKNLFEFHDIQHRKLRSVYKAIP